MSGPKIIDGGIDVAHIVSHVDIGGLRAGESRHVVLPANVLREGAGVGHSDLINAKGFSVKTHVVGDDNAVFGVAILKGGATKKELQPLETKGREIFVSPTGRAEGFHEIVFPKSSGSAVHPLYNTQLDKTVLQMAKKRAGTDWENETHETVHNNVFKSTATDAQGNDETKYLAAKGGAVHRFVEKNMDKLPEFKKFTKPEYRTVVQEKDAFVMAEPEFKKVHETLATSLKPVGPWEHGVTVSVTNLSNKQIAAGAHALVSTKFHRTPIDRDATAGSVVYEEGYTPGATTVASLVHPKAISEPKVEPLEPSS